MLYTPSHVELAQHPKTRKLARLLDCSIPTAIGHLNLLWHFALKYAPDGNLARFDCDEIGDGCMWEGDGARFTEALIQSGWLDTNTSAETAIHDWHEYGGKYVQRKETNAQRMREARANHKQDTKKPRAKHVQRTSNARAHLEERIGEENIYTPPAPPGDEIGADAPPPNAPIPIKRAERATRIPPNFPLTDEMREWARRKVPALELDYAHEEFCTYWRGKGGTNVDWFQTWQNGMLKAHKRLQELRPRYVSQGELNSGKARKFVGA